MTINNYTFIIFLTLFNFIFISFFMKKSLMNYEKYLNKGKKYPTYIYTIIVVLLTAISSGIGLLYLINTILEIPDILILNTFVLIFIAGYFYFMSEFYRAKSGK